MNTAIFLIYIISLISAAVCLWVKWSQEEDRDRVGAVERRCEELEQELETLRKDLRKVGDRDPFKK